MNQTIEHISIVIPVYNETANIKPLITEIQKHISTTLEYEIIVVDDGSDDNTWQELTSVKQIVPQLRIIRHKMNRGQSAALLSGVRQAKYDWVITLDGDQQNDPADINTLLETWQQQAAHHHYKFIVVGHRQKRKDTWLKRFTSRFANRIRQFTLRDQCPDTGCSLKLFPRIDFLELPHFNHFHRFLPALFKRTGLHIINTPVNHRPRLYGQSKYGLNNRLWAGISDLLGVIWLMRRPCQAELSDDSD